MAVSWTELSGLLEEQLQLQLQPVALAFAEAPPADVPRLDATMPSACSGATADSLAEPSYQACAGLKD